MPSPATTATIFFLACVLVISFILDKLFTALAIGGFAKTASFHTWIAFMSASAAVGVVVFLTGLAQVTRNVKADRARPIGRKTPLWPYIVGLVVIVGITVLLLFTLTGGSGFTVPILGWQDFWRYLIPATAAVAVAPWVICVWWTHDELARLGPVLRGDKLDSEGMLKELQTAWTDIEHSTGALVATVTAGVLTTGALRLAVIDGKVPNPPTEADILKSGLLFAGIVAVAVAPLILAYRRKASEFLERRYPPKDRADDKDAADVLAGQLHLDVGPLRSPWALMAILTPVLTAALAAYLPGLT